MSRAARSLQWSAPNGSRPTATVSSPGPVSSGGARQQAACNDAACSPNCEAHRDRPTRHGRTADPGRAGRRPAHRAKRKTRGRRNLGRRPDLGGIAGRAGRFAFLRGRQGIAVKLTVGAAAAAIHTQIGLALNSSNVQIDLSLVDQTGYWVITLSGNAEDNQPIYYYDSDGTTLIGSTTNVFGISGFNGTQTFSGAETFGRLQPLYDELVSGGLFVNSIAGSDEKAGLTRVNNSTALTSPSTTDNATELAKAKTLARAYLAYKKKKK